MQSAIPTRYRLHCCVLRTLVSDRRRPRCRRRSRQLPAVPCQTDKGIFEFESNHYQLAIYLRGRRRRPRPVAYTCRSGLSLESIPGLISLLFALAWLALCLFRLRGVAGKVITAFAHRFSVFSVILAFCSGRRLSVAPSLSAFLCVGSLSQWDPFYLTRSGVGRSSAL